MDWNVSEAQRINDEYNARKSVRCPVCSKRLVPLASGRVRRHSRDLHIGTFVRTEVCHGSGVLLTKATTDRSSQ